MSEDPKASLTAALNDLLREEFDGIPSNQQIALGLNRIVASCDLSLREAILLDALETALIDRTADGWSFPAQIAGPKGPKRSKDRGKQRREIAERYAENLAEFGDAYARRKAIQDGDPSAKEAYEENKAGKRLARFLKARASHEKRLEELRSKRARSSDSDN